MRRTRSFSTLHKSTLALGLGLALVLAGCSKPAEEEDAAPSEAAYAPSRGANDGAAAEASDASSVPGADSQVAPGVAFTYQFNFRLADDQVSVAQDRHVEACQRLGSAHCRVTDLNYNRRANGPINANITFLVDPALARGFTRDAVDAVQRIDGELLDSSVGGRDVGSSIDESQQRSAALGGDAQRIERRLARPGLGDRERRELQQQLAALRGALNDEEGQRRGNEARLATTPVQFTYVGKTGVAGFDSSRPFASALAASTSSFGTAAAFVLTLLGLALPWLLMLGGVILLWRWLRGRMGRAPVVPVVDQP